MKYAFLSAGTEKPMGTFRFNYLNQLPYTSVVFFGGRPPYLKESTPKWRKKMISIYFLMMSFGDESKINVLKERRLKKLLKGEKVDFVIAEFLNTGASVIKVCEDLGLPMISLALGYEVRKFKEIEKNRNCYNKLAEYNKSFVVPVTKSMIPILKEFGFDKHQIFPSPIGARKEFLNINPDYNSKIIFAIGRFSESKDPIKSIRAFAKLITVQDKYHLVFAGDGKLLKQCEALVSELNISNNVSFIGWISQEEQQEWLSKSSIFIQHSVTTPDGDAEGTPVAIIEASAAGLVVVSTRHAGIPEVILDEKTGFLVDEGDWEEMGTKLIYLSENKEKLVQMGSEAKKFISNNFTIEHHLNVIKNIVENSFINSFDK